MKKATSVFLAVLMIVTIVPFSAFAQDTDPITTSTSEELTTSAGSALGDALASAMSEEEEERDAYDGNGIYNVSISGFSAEVSLAAPDASTLVVAVYDEDTMEMITTGNATVDSDTQAVTVELAEYDVLPDYYIIKAFILDSENAPVCKNYENKDYTRAYWEFYAKNVDDFDEETVINLDASNETNFAVVSEEAASIVQTEDENIVITDDYENGIYVFENANSDITSLSAGDILYYVYGDEADDYILTKIGSIETKDGLTTVTAAESCEMSEFFQYVDIDTSKTSSVTPKARGYFDDDKGDVNKDKYFDISSGEASKEFKGDNYSLTLKVTGRVGFHVKFRYDVHIFTKDYYEFSYWLDVYANANATFIATASFSKEMSLIDANFTVIPGLDIHFALKIAVKASASLTLTGDITFEMKYGAIATSNTGTEKIEKKPTITPNIDVRGDFTIDFIPEVQTGFTVLKVFFADLSVPIDFQINGNLFVPTSSDEISSHSCYCCISGDIFATIKLGINVSFGLKREKAITIIDVTPYEHIIPFGSYYISISSDSGVTFGWGTCPNISSTSGGSDDSGNSGSDDSGSTVDPGNSGSDDSGSTVDPGNSGSDDSGSTVDPGNSGSGDSGSTVDPGNSGSDDPGDTGVSGETDTEYTPNTSGEMASGTCGNNLTWTLYNDGELVISGTGTMYKGFASSLYPWNSYRSSIKSVVIEKGVTAIGDYAFDSCDSLESVTIGNSVTTIGEYAFYYCDSLESVTIPDSVTTIGDYAFKYCTSLESVTIPDSVTTIGDCAFYNCTSLESIEIPDSVTTIGDWAFYGCKSLESVTIGNSVTTIGNYAFDYCDSLESVTIGNSVTTIGDRAFRYCDSLESVTIPDSVTTIGEYAFENCTSLESVTIGNSVTTIGEYAFEYCTSLESVTIPDSVTTIGKYAFYGCNSLESVTIPDSVTTIGKHAFYGCGSLESVTIPDSVTTIGECAFCYCTSLESVTIGNSVTQIDEYVFYGCESLESVTIPDSVTMIDISAFEYCTSLESVTIPDSVTTIGDYAFYGCTSLESVTIGNSVKIIGRFTFNDCTSLESVTIPDSVTKIGDYAFYSCDSLERVTIPDSVTTIGNSAFEYCTNLKTVDYKGTEDQWKNINIRGNNSSLINATIVYNSSDSAKARSMAYPVNYNAVVDETAMNTAITSAVVGNEYVMLIVRDENAEDLLAADNLLFIDQKTADGETLIFEFNLKDNESDYKILFTNSGFEFENHEHFSGEWEVLTEAQVGIDGLEQQKCTICGEVLDERVIPALDDSLLFTLGDVNGDSKITAADARLALRISAQLELPTDAQILAADLTFDGKVTAADARKILRISANLDTI